MKQKSLWAIELKEDDSDTTMIVYDWQKSCFAIYEFKKYAKSNIERIYQDYKKRLNDQWLKHIPRRKFVIKQYVERVV